MRSQTAKLFMNGRSQAVRLPANYRFSCDEVFIRRDEKTGDIIISKKPNSWSEFFDLSADVPQDFMSVRDNDSDTEKDLF